MKSEIEAKQMTPMLTTEEFEKQVVNRFGPGFDTEVLVTNRFGVEQGSKLFGSYKLRPIDDYCWSELNSSSQLNFAVILQDLRHMAELGKIARNTKAFQNTRCLAFK